ncbi:MAG: SagB/ThcOx family dehydrogenase [Candidatus Paceibacteria bacterium]
MKRQKRLFGRKLYEIFHENTINYELNNSYYPLTDEKRSLENKKKKWEKIEYKDYKGVEKISLDNFDETEVSRGLKDILQNRNSPDVFDKYKISIKEINSIIKNSAGITRKLGEDKNLYRRAYTSGGARYPLEIYLFVINSELDQGIYHYNVKKNKLEKIKDLELLKLSEAMYSNQLGEASLVIIISADFERSTKKYGDKGYRNVNLEAGHVMQNFCLMAESCNLSCLPYGGLKEKKIDDLIGLEEETVIYAGIIGKGKKNRSSD